MVQIQFWLAWLVSGKTHFWLAPSINARGLAVDLQSKGLADETSMMRTFCDLFLCRTSRVKLPDSQLVLTGFLYVSYGQIARHNDKLIRSDGGSDFRRLGEGEIPFYTKTRYREQSARQLA